MTNNFCAGVCASTVHKWNKLSPGNVDEDVRVMTRKSVDDPGEPPGIVLSAATSVWLPVSPQRLFDFLRDERLRSEWDILSNGGPMQEMAHIAKGQDHGNCVSLLRASVSFFLSFFFIYHHHIYEIMIIIMLFSHKYSQEVCLFKFKLNI
jgi:homeobox-leucine zipper protein